MTSKITAFFQENLELIKMELTHPVSQDIASSDSSFSIELLPSQESVASDSPVESEHKMLQATQN